MLAETSESPAIQLPNLPLTTTITVKSDFYSLFFTMCSDQTVIYTCGCKHAGKYFKQCPEREGTNVRCNNVESKDYNVDGYCLKHTVPVPVD
ncbi:uncharacterized protein ARMOST_12134 [Armillaria ostoyae]|uniref:Uncharacterized protein n=1 Tax=Armillaria ostoyae TaxID=47428 RepID=A0A284RJ26_ARMOS|nr:uncharacterized protein ARMOST_12134 [Armillaria ostoyae]